MNWLEAVTTAVALYGFYLGMRLMTRNAQPRRRTFRPQHGPPIRFVIPPSYALWVGGVLVAGFEAFIIVTRIVA